MERMNLTIDGINATLRFALPDGTKVVREFFASCGGVYERFGVHEKQVCERLQHSGNTLRAMDPYKLPEMIRKHYKRMRYDMMKAWDSAWEEHTYEAIDYNPAAE